VPELARRNGTPGFTLRHYRPGGYGAPVAARGRPVRKARKIERFRSEPVYHASAREVRVSGVPAGGSREAMALKP